ncbi:NADH oxidase [Spiroplasma litorale]|uniref:NADH oxidase n=1 Tax=Spiroplasma litorale TaxID=216942 RepID=A0A0K1W1E5_9MOLU|nr:CoA-disulfide reductase [Spiroplasma litorale]AKX33993.1 NADH oxidase [Spiroplasma litorale]
MKVVIIGGGATGMGVASKIKRNNNNIEVTVIENGSYVSLGACGLPYYVGDEFKDSKKLFARSVEKFNESGIEIHLNSSIEKIDIKNKKLIVKNKEINFDKLVIATGAEAFIPSIKGLDTIDFYKLTKYEDGINLKAIVEKKEINNILIIGAGFIGMELAENLKNINKNVSIVELDSRIASKIYDEEVSDLIKNNLEQNQINLFLNNSVKEFIKKDNKIIAKLMDRDIKVDLVVVASGFRPNTRLFENTELKLSANNAIIVDDYGKTNIDYIYSGGDCCVIKNKITNNHCYSPLATVASKQAKVIANNISNINSKFYGSIQSSIIKLFDSGVARAGLTEKEAKDLNINIKTVFIKDKNHTHYLDGQSDIYLKLIKNVDTNELIGAQMYSNKNSILRFYSIATLIWNKTKLNEEIEQIDLPYSPPFSRTFDIIHIALSKIIS